MPAIAITSWGHSAVRLERDGQRLVIDPGNFSDLAVLDGAHAVLITHGHVDHIEPPALADALTRDPGLHVWAPPEVADQLADAGLDADRVHGVSDGEEFTAAGFTIKVVGRTHAEVLPGVSAGANVGYLVDGAYFHPGDAFTVPSVDTPLAVLFVPVAAPWMKLAEAVEYLQQVSPTMAVPIHDAILSDAGKALADRILSGLPGPTDYRRLNAGDVLRVGMAG